MVVNQQKKLYKHVHELILTHKTRSQEIHQKGEISYWAHKCSCYEKSHDHQMSQALRKVTNQILTRIKHMKIMEMRLENHIATPVMCQEQSESINHMFSKPPSNIYIGREKADDSVLGLVR
jgi:hypothetical protein